MGEPVHMNDRKSAYYSANDTKTDYKNGAKRAKEVDDDDRFIIINKWMKLDLKSNILLSNNPIDKGTRILIELPLFTIGQPTQTSHPANSLFLYHKFINNTKKDLQKEILYKKFPLKKLNKNIGAHTENLKKLLKKNNKLNDKSIRLNGFINPSKWNRACSHERS